MQWRKMGHVFVPDGTSAWARHSALTPTPILKDDETIRVFAGFRDNAGVSRIGYVDLNARNPAVVKKVSSKPVLDVGRPGTFDDNGVILGDVLCVGDSLYMYYVGFQLVEKVKFLAFTGLAISRDGGESFCRYSNAPILDRSNNELYIRAIHSVMEIDGEFRVWYAAGSGWEIIDGRPFPRYNIHCLTSRDGIHFEGEGPLCIDVRGTEYRIGRPRVFKMGGLYRMHYTKGTIEGDYLAGYAESTDGLSWSRKDSQVGIAPSIKGWDSCTLSYPALLAYHDKIYMFYNGNDMGKTGFGYALLESL